MNELSKINLYISNNKMVFQNIKYIIKDQYNVTINKIIHTVYKIEDNSFFYFVDNNLHRENDLPAIEWEDGSKIWAINHQIHRRTNKPAIIWKFGKVEYYWKNIPTTKSKVDRKFIEKKMDNF